MGKTSLISRFVEQKFSEQYLASIGLKVDKKTVQVEYHTLDLIIWDVAGQDNVDNIPHYYLNGSHGIIFVADLTRPATYIDIGQRIARLRQLVPQATFVVAANKKDLVPTQELATILQQFAIPPDVITSAKTGDEVETLFLLLAKHILSSHDAA
ncbi:MAG: Rab family GTPase [Bacteroidia bacterium]